MRISSRRALLLVTVLLVVCAGSFTESPSAAPRTVPEAMPQTEGYLETVRLFHAALASGDGRGALVRLAADVTIFESGGAEMSRTEYAEHHLHGDTQFAAATERTIVDRQHGRTGEIAWVTSRTETHGTFGEREIHSRGTETMLLRHDGTEWRIFHVHWSSRPIEP